MANLEKIPLGKSGMNITRVGVGTAPIGSSPSWRVYWGPQDEKTAIRAIQKALDLGVNWVDTAPFYGWGRAEEIVGKAIKDCRDQVHIFTKCGTLPDGKGGEVQDNSPVAIRRDVEQSLRRLDVDHIDLLQIHDVDPNTAIEESWRAVHQLIREGKVSHGGLSNHPIDLVQRALKIGPVVSDQLQYSPLERGIERELMPFCLQNNIGILGWGSLAEGFLTDNFDLNVLDPNDFRRKHKYAQNYDRVERVRRVFSQVAARHGTTMAEAVITWELAHPALTGAIVGIRNEKEVEQMVQSQELHLTSQDSYEIEQTHVSSDNRA